MASEGNVKDARVGVDDNEEELLRQEEEHLKINC